jgi:hypothetical protein
VRGKIVETGAAGANRFSFGGKVGGHMIGPGSYRLTGIPAGGSSRQARLTIVR